MANIQQVAKQAGVSVATVSRVLNGQDTVSYKT
ncbi:MAG: LacI family DNA-binding transcriptional regulator, partial [Paenisporosarcina sp.]